jgi:hypothetical protein
MAVSMKVTTIFWYVEPIVWLSWRRTTLNESGKHSWSDLRFIARSREGCRQPTFLMELRTLLFIIIVWLKYTDILEVHTASILRVVKEAVLT